MSDERAFRMEQFHDYLVFERGLSERTVTAYARDLRRWREHVVALGAGGPADVTLAQLRSWVFELKAGGLAPTSIRRAQSAVRTYFAFLLAEGAVTSDPTDRLEAPRTTRRLPDVLDPTEVERLLVGTDEAHPLHWRDRAILELLYATGVRITELVALDRADLTLDDGLVRVFGKGAKERVVPVGRPARESVEQYLRLGRPDLVRSGSATRRAGDAVFLNARGGRLTRQGCWGIVRDAGGRAGLGDRVHPHVLRHSCATHLLDHGADIRVVQEVLGHPSVSTTQVYTKVTAERLRVVYDRAHPRSRSRP
jgi:integrase/recombinase XerD